MSLLALNNIIASRSSSFIAFHSTMVEFSFFRLSRFFLYKATGSAFFSTLFGSSAKDIIRAFITNIESRYESTSSRGWKRDKFENEVKLARCEALRSNICTAA